MRLRTKYILFIALLHLVTLVLSFYVFKDNKLLFIISEVFILISIALSWQLYNQLLQPLRTLMTGIDALKDRDFNIKFRKTGKYEMDKLIEVYNQMADQLRIERTTQEQQHFFLEKLIYTSPTGIIILDYDDIIEQVNPRALELLQLEEKDLKGKQVQQLTHPILKEATSLQLGEAKTVSINGINTYKLQVSQFIDRGFPRNFIMIEELTAEILAAEKKVYGKVIRMMAHEVNNTIGPVNSILNTTLRKKEFWKEAQNQSLQEALQVAMDRNQNLNLFVRNFADLVKLPPPNRKKIDLRQLIHHVVHLMQIRAAEKDIVLEWKVPNEPFLIWADEQQLEQVFINIVKNAIESIGEKGTISFCLDLVRKTLKITDTGKGISDEDAGKLFSPFFSTKKDGQGIGLTLVREILLNHHYEFFLKTVAPQQTEFVIHFADKFKY